MIPFPEQDQGAQGGPIPIERAGNEGLGTATDRIVVELYEDVVEEVSLLLQEGSHRSARERALRCCS